MGKVKEISDYIIEMSDLFKSTDGEEYLVVKKDNTESSSPISSVEVADLIREVCIETTNDCATTQVINGVKDVLAYRARTNKKTKRVFHRIAPVGNVIYVDLGTGKYVKITAKKTAVVNRCPVLFYRPNNSLPLPEPVFDKGGYKALAKVMNVEKQDRLLVLAWLMAPFMPAGVFPVLVLKGEQGSAKTTTLKFLKKVLGPSVVGVQALHKKEEDVLIAAQTELVMMYDNVSYISNEMSDVFCRLVAGSGLSKRKLYSNGESYVIKAKCPIGLNGIADFVTRGDLLDRSILLEAPLLSGKKRLTEGELEAYFEENHGRILGSLMMIAQEGLRRKEEVNLESVPRLADWVKWTVAWTPAVASSELSIMKKLMKNAEGRIWVGLEADIVGGVLVEFFKDQEEWEGNASKLLKEAGWFKPSVTNKKHWPKSASQMGARLKRHIPALRALGFEVTSGRKNSRRFYRVEWKGKM